MEAVCARLVRCVVLKAVATRSGFLYGNFGNFGSLIGMGSGRNSTLNRGITM